MKETILKALKTYGLTFLFSGAIGTILILVGDLDAGKFALPAGIGAALAALGRAIVDYLESRQ